MVDRPPLEASADCGGPAKVLLVDDRPENLLALEEVLRPLGQHLTTARSGDEALRAVLRDDFAVILLDVKMPGLDGFETAARIKQRDRSRHIPIVFLTAASHEPGEVLQGYSAGAVDYLSKPFDPAVLLSKVSVFVDLYMERRRAEAAEQALLDDIAERKQFEAQLREAFEREQHMVAELKELSRAKSDFVSTISHELRTPLTSVYGYIELLADGSLGELADAQRDVLEVIERNLRRLRSLIEDLLTLASIDSGRLCTATAPVDIGALVEAVHRTVQPAAASQRLSLDVAVEPDVGTLMADAGQLERVLLNLLSNAIKFTGKGGRVTVRVERADQEVVFSVVDTGIGIPIEEQDQLFSRFFRSSSAVEQAIQGTGLGLAIVKTIIDEHGGRIRVDSMPGTGTTVTFTLPLSKPTGDVMATTRKARKGARRSSPASRLSAVPT